MRKKERGGGREKEGEGREMVHLLRTWDLIQSGLKRFTKYIKWLIDTLLKKNHVIWHVMKHMSFLNDYNVILHVILPN